MLQQPQLQSPIQEQPCQEVVSFLNDGAVAEGQMSKAPPDRQPSKRLVTATIFVSFLFLGVCDAVIGPTLIDIRDTYGSSFKKVSFVFLFRSLGSIVGTLLAGYLLDKFSGARYFILTYYCAMTGLYTLLTPLVGNLVGLYSVSLLYGLHSGSLDAGGNVLCINIWRGMDGGPQMHSIHFAFGVGAFLAPLIASPFLSPSLQNDSDQTQDPGLNGTHWREEGAMEAAQHGGIRALFLLIGLATVFVSLLYLFFGIRHVGAERSAARKGVADQHAHSGSTSASSPVWRAVFVGLMCVFFLLYTGAEVLYGSYIMTFAVQSQLQLTKVQGAQVNAMFWGSFAGMRLLAIFLAMKWNPIFVMASSFIISVVASLLLCIWAQSSVLLLQLCSAFLGVGMASIYASGLLWAEKYIQISNKIGALLTVSSSLGADIFPIVLGQYVDQLPMLLMYLELATVSSCVVLFALASLVGSVIRSGQLSHVLRLETAIDSSTINAKEQNMAHSRHG